MDIKNHFDNYFSSRNVYKLSTPLLRHLGPNYFIYKESEDIIINHFADDFKKYSISSGLKWTDGEDLNEEADIIFIDNIESLKDMYEKQKNILEVVVRMNEKGASFFCTSLLRAFDLKEGFTPDFIQLLDECNRAGVKTAYGLTVRNIFDVAFCIYSSFDTNSQYYKNGFSIKELEEMTDKAFGDFDSLTDFTYDTYCYVLDGINSCRNYFLSLLRSSNIVRGIENAENDTIDYFLYKLKAYQEKFEADFYSDY